MGTLHVAEREISTKLVIFDKDGTLIDFKETWIGIIDNLISVTSRHVPMTPNLKERIQGALGIAEILKRHIQERFGEDGKSSHTKVNTDKMDKVDIK